jgi:hypothetical protein
VPNLLHFHRTAKPTATLKTHERNLIVKRLSQIEVALGHPQWTPEQLESFMRERAELQRELAADESAR